jgi:signal transduction histidine kinase
MTLLQTRRLLGLNFDLLLPLRRSVPALILAIGLSNGMPTAMALYVMHEFRHAQLLDAQAAGELLTEGFLSPHTRRALRNGTIRDTEAQEMNRDFDRIADLSPILGAVIWDLEGNAIYSSVGIITEDMFLQDDFQLALQGGSSHVEVTDMDAFGRHDTVPLPYLELYAPIRTADTGELIAVGETLMDISQMLVTRRDAAQSVLIASALASLALCFLVVLNLLQRARMLQQLADASHLVLQNNRLRQSAERARVLASQSNEALLNQLGAEIHDGPVQVLSLLMLSNDLDESQTIKSAGMDRKSLISSVMTELRAISDGLILPEMNPDSLAGSIALAIARHETLTGHRVVRDLSGLPRTVDPELAVCLFRFVQEGLTNAFRHAGSATEHVTGRLEGHEIVLTVSDGGSGAGSREAPITSHRGLGLQGIRNRLRVFDGTITLLPNAEGGMDLTLRVVPA